MTFRTLIQTTYMYSPSQFKPYHCIIFRCCGDSNFFKTNKITSTRINHIDNLYTIKSLA